MFFEQQISMLEWNEFWRIMWRWRLE